MPTVQGSIEIARPPDEVFGVVTDSSRYPEWQASVLSSRPEDDGPVVVGSKTVVTRRVGPRQVVGIEQVTEFDPPRRWTVRATGGPVTAAAKGEIRPVDTGRQSFLTIALQFEGQGVGKLLVPLIARQARKQLSGNLRKLKDLIERIV
jgi:uncharacterized protein YndB with AHSA1/START domain